MKRTADTYFPRPIYTGDVELPASLLARKPVLAKQAHDMWAIMKWIAYIKDHQEYFDGTEEEFQELISYKDGDPIPYDLLEKCTAVPDHKDFIPYEELTPEVAAYDDTTALGALRLFYKLGLAKEE